MRVLAILAVLAAVAVAGGAPTTDAERQLARVEAHRKVGREALDAFKAAKSDSARLRAADRARAYLGRALAIARARKEPEFAAAAKQIKLTLADVFVREARVYFARRSFPKARETVGLALRADPGNARARSLLDAIVKAEQEDFFDTVNGIAALNRFRARRAAAGLPVRITGVARRR